MGSLLHLRDKDLGELAPKLYPFIRAYAPFQKLPTPSELREAGYEKIEEMSFLEECEGVYVESRGCTPEEWVRLHPEDEIEDTM
jgi:hypothetical protein